MDRALLMEEMRRAKRRGEAVEALRRADLYLADHPEDAEVKEARERLGDREERRFFLKYYAPLALAAFLAIGYSGERRAVSVLAAVVVAMPVALLAYGIVRLLKTLRGGRGHTGGPRAKDRRNRSLRAANGASSSAGTSR